ncbi:MAG: hypothetical protein JWQ01_1914 [Massilia sp.]|nr:hypothetical protein [Massilia sp.]
MLQRQFSRLALTAVLVSSLACAQAVELGDSLVRSHIGQPLSADIELIGIDNDTASVQAALADADVYRGANIAMHPALASLNITIVRRDGRRFVHLASAKAVESEFVNVFLALNENGRRSVRQATLWFTPDPHPTPLAEAPAPQKVVPLVQRPLPVAVARTPVVAPVLRVPPPAQPAACVQQFSAAQIGTCTALDGKNAALKAQIVDLEAKVARLSAAVKAAAPPQPIVKPAPAKLTPMGAPEAAAPKPARAPPWLFLGIAGASVLGLAGALSYVLLRKRKAAKAKPAEEVSPVRPSFIASVKRRLLPARKESEQPA